MELNGLFCPFYLIYCAGMRSQWRNIITFHLWHTWGAVSSVLPQINADVLRKNTANVGGHVDCRTEWGCPKILVGPSINLDHCTKNNNKFKLIFWLFFKAIMWLKSIYLMVLCWLFLCWTVNQNEAAIVKVIFKMRQL